MAKFCPLQPASNPETGMISDVADHTLCVYNGRGLLQYVEYPSRQHLVFSYGEEGLERITTPLGNVLEVECRGGRILQITDEIGRRTQYRYEEDCLVNVVHTDEHLNPRRGTPGERCPV